MENGRCWRGAGPELGFSEVRLSVFLSVAAIDAAFWPLQEATISILSGTCEDLKLSHHSQAPILNGAPGTRFELNRARQALNTVMHCLSSTVYLSNALDAH